MIKMLKINNSGLVFYFGCIDKNNEEKFDLETLYSRLSSHCSCGFDLDVIYLMIINRLEKAHFLPEDYKRLCCMCSFLDKLGMLYLKDKCIGWDSDGEYNILLYFNPENEEGGTIKIRIHDFKKVLLS